MNAADEPTVARADPPVAEVDLQVADEGTLRSLEWPALLEVLATFTATDGGADRLRALDPLPPGAESEREQRRQRIVETGKLIVGDGGALVPSVGIPVVPLLAAAERSDRFAVEGLPPLASVIQAGVRAARRVGSRAHEVPSLAEWSISLLPAERLDVLEAFARDVHRILDDRAEVRPDASPALVRLRGRIRSDREALYQSFGDYVEQHGDQLAEDTVSMRDGRLSVLLPAGSRGRLEGLVHGRSGTGQSYYFEPLQLVEDNNRLQAAIAAEDEERQRLVAQLMGSLGELRDDLPAIGELVAELDLYQAVSRYARLVSATMPSLDADRPLRVCGARHPLLDPALRGARESALGVGGNREPVVPLDLDLEAAPVLVVTGPNAGGKTVALKTVGLLALLALAGLPVPAESGTSFPTLEKVCGVLGDQQDLLTDRSTFSGHLLRLKAAWEAAGPNSLVLVDELGSGTSPQEGGALALTLLESLIERGGYALLTTHLVEVAAAAYELDGAGSLATELDANSGRPTFRLQPGPPGGSHALDLARRLALPAEWLDRAEARLGSEYRDLRALLLEVESERDLVRSQRQGLERARADQEALTQRLAAELEEAQNDRRTLRKRVDSELGSLRREARSRLREESRRLGERIAQQQGSDASKRPSRRSLERAVQSGVEESLAGAERLDELVPPTVTVEPVGEVAVGDLVRHVSLGWTGRLTRIDGDRVEVSVSGKRVRCRRDELAAVEAKAKPPPSKAALVTAPPKPGVSIELNLVGERVEPALERLERYLDDALRDNLPTVRVIHGHGSGALRAALRERLRDHPAVSDHASAPPEQGGNGATLVTLRGA